MQSIPFGLDAIPNVLKDSASEEKGETARLSSFVGAIAVCDLVKTTLGPKVRRRKCLWEERKGVFFFNSARDGRSEREKVEEFWKRMRV